MLKINAIVTVVLFISSIAILFSVLEMKFPTTEAQVTTIPKQLANLTDGPIWEIVQPFGSTLGLSTGN